MSVRPGEYLLSPGQRVEYVYFPITAVLTMLASTSDDAAVEVATIGIEGVAPLEVLNGVPTASLALVVQVPGDVLRVPRAAFIDILDARPDLRARLQHFQQALFFFAAQTSACNRAHTVVQRCARWLLLTHDRVDGDDFAMTHLHLAQMLGIRRSSVTVAAEYFRSRGLISYTRGRIRIVDPQRLLAESCQCCASVREMYRVLL